MTVAPVKPAPPSSEAFLAAVQSRRSLYSLAKSSPIADEKIVEIVQTAVKHAPSPFNTQSSRAVILFGSKHEKFWNVAAERFKAAVPSDFFDRIAPKLLQMKDAYGTVLLFEDSAAFEPLLAKMPFIAPNLPGWSENVHGIVSYIIWTALDAEGLGASFQHYTDVVQKDVEEMLQVPSTWKLRANLVFGAPTVPPMEKAFQSLEDRVKVFA
ncbi:Putative nitroreductase [Rhodotorula toruloides]